MIRSASSSSASRKGHQPMFNLRLFELIEPLEASRSAKARLLKWDGARYIATGEEITVHDFAGSHGTAQDRGYAFLSDQSKKWEVLAGLFTQEYESIL